MNYKDQSPSLYNKHPNYDVHFEPCNKRIRVIFNGEVLVDTNRAKYLHETNHVPVYYFLLEDLRQDLLHPTSHSTHCPFKGDASYWSVEVSDKVAENAVWTYSNPYPETREIKGFVSIYWNQMDHWYEEGKEVFGAARSHD